MVDKAGRLVLPKEIREAIGVCGRTWVQVEVVNNSARISAPDIASAVKRKGGRFIYSGPLPQDWKSGEAVIESRRRRMPDVQIP